MNRAELVMRRRNVLAFIQADPAKIELVRAGEVSKTAAGGKVRSAGTSLAPQLGRIIPPKRRFDNGLVNSEAGSIPHSQWLLLGTHRFNGMVDDQFRWLGQNYRITAIHPTRTESFLATIDFTGPDNE